jgi:hypothetical protein
VDALKGRKKVTTGLHVAVWNTIPNQHLTWTGLAQSRQGWAQSHRQYTAYDKALQQRHSGFASVLEISLGDGVHLIGVEFSEASRSMFFG